MSLDPKSFGRIRSALISALMAEPTLGFPLAYPNTTYRPGDTVAAYGDVSFHFADDRAASLGSNGEDEILGYLQVNIKVKPQTGEALAYDLAGRLRERFPIGFSCSFEGQHVTISQRKFGAFGIIENWFTLPVIINFYARIPKT